jgi:hypothetical protein
MGPMHDPDLITSLQGLRITCGDELLFDGSDPSTYTICETAEDLAAALSLDCDTETQS